MLVTRKYSIIYYTCVKWQRLYDLYSTLNTYIHIETRFKNSKNFISIAYKCIAEGTDYNIIIWYVTIYMNTSYAYIDVGDEMKLKPRSEYNRFSARNFSLYIIGYFPPFVQCILCTNAISDRIAYEWIKKINTTHYNLRYSHTTVNIYTPVQLLQ